MKLKNYKKIETISKGFANHRRIKILDLLGDGRKRSLNDISDKLKMNVKTASVHVSQMNRAGLVDKKYAGQSMDHKITSLGMVVLRFLRKLD